jgi:two-component system, chemotaxis family, chemotaxis protein CheY
VTQPGKILVLEDSSMMRTLYRTVLARSGAELLFAEDGVEGLDRATAEPGIGLFIVDVNLPRLDGISFIRRLRSEIGAEAPVVVVSTECGEADKAAAFEAGADAYLCKPWAPNELLDLIGGLPDRT